MPRQRIVPEYAYTLTGAKRAIACLATGHPCGELALTP